MDIFEKSLSRMIRVCMQAGREAGLIALDTAGKIIVQDIKQRVGIPGNGIPSDPGEPPRKQTGKLQRSVKYKVYKRDMMVAVFITAPYAYYLEYGTVFMAPRPYLRRGVSGFVQRGKLKDYFAFAFSQRVGRLTPTL